MSELARIRKRDGEFEKEIWRRINFIKEADEKYKLNVRLRIL